MSVDLRVVFLHGCVFLLRVRGMVPSFSFYIRIVMRELRRIGRGKCVAMLVLAIVMNFVDAYPPGTVFNDGEYKALCGVFHASLDLWNASRESNLKLGAGLEISLSQALFGKESGGSIEDITESLPPEYNNAPHRGWMCGYCSHTEPAHPGKSITHDLMCLCTPGQYAEPFYGYYWLFGFRENGFKLCGKLRQEMGVDLRHGWYSEGRKKQAKGLDMSWKAVIMGCVNSWKNGNITGSPDLSEKLTRLNTTLQEFVSKLYKDDKRRPKLGGTHGDKKESDGTTEQHIHVRYRYCGEPRRGGGRPKRPWWKKMQDVLKKTKSQLFLEHSTPTLPEENEDDTEQGEGQEEDFETVEGGLESGTPEVIKSPKQGENITHTNGPTNSTIWSLNGTDNVNSTYPRLEYLRSSTTITRPLCLLSTSFLI
ncbi:Variant surface glycoprotein [Trypanosoma congolense IL3000]|uniref:Variant surface glycoprotein n=1 Tax=Trypanosoma congolense (strain IL3000) TaxID=1068625 RepID=F9W515_TRYCI|nr:Variant surface glycoprotein [Trypanosoma congolense IL3000]